MEDSYVGGGLVVVLLSGGGGSSCSGGWPAVQAENDVGGKNIREKEGENVEGETVVKPKQVVEAASLQYREGR